MSADHWMAGSNTWRCVADRRPAARRDWTATRRMIEALPVPVPTLVAELESIQLCYAACGCAEYAPDARSLIESRLSERGVRPVGQGNRARRRMARLGMLIVAR